MRTVPAHRGGYEPAFGPLSPRLGAVDAVGLEAHAGDVASRSIERESRREALELAIRVLDLSAPDETTPHVLCARALLPDPGDPSLPCVAAVSVAPRLVSACRARLDGTGVLVSSSSPEADEVEVSFDHGAFLTGRYAAVHESIRRAGDGAPCLKVVVESGVLGGYDDLRRASLLAIVAGADFVAVDAPAARALPAALCVLEAIRDVHDATGHAVGFACAGGVESAEQAVQQLVLVHETLGAAWLAPARLRIAGAGLLDAIVAEIRA
jgi:deoxyribose-phosphate aldolase